MRRGSRGLKLDYPALHARYMEGESGMALAREVGNIVIAQAARRGTHDPMSRRMKRAETREAKGIGISDNEVRLAERLTAEGWTFRQQAAIGPYNADFAFVDLHMVLEVDGGGHNPRVRANRDARHAFLTEQGWSVFHVQTRVKHWMDVAMSFVHAIASVMSHDPS